MKTYGVKNGGIDGFIRNCERKQEKTLKELTPHLKLLSQVLDTWAADIKDMKSSKNKQEKLLSYILMSASELVIRSSIYSLSRMISENQK